MNGPWLATTLQFERLEERSMLTADAGNMIALSIAEGENSLLSSPTQGTVRESVKIASGTAGSPILANNDNFGQAVASLGDLDGDGVVDLAVGARRHGGGTGGAVYVLFMQADGSVRQSVLIASNVNGGPPSALNDGFGSSLAAIGDLDGDGVTELVVGSPADSQLAAGTGAVHVLFLQADGTVRASEKTLNNSALDRGFGSSVASMGDLDGDGIPDLAVGIDGENSGGIRSGAVQILLMNADGTVRDRKQIASQLGGGPLLSSEDRFGTSVAALGDLDGDGITELAVGAEENRGGRFRGAVYVLFLQADGTARAHVRIASNIAGGPNLADGARFGGSLAPLGDADGDGIADLAVGAPTDSTQGAAFGAVHVLFLKSSGAVKNRVKIASGVGGGPNLADLNKFGSSVAALEDLDGDGILDLAVGAEGDATGGFNRGAAHILFLNPAVASTPLDFGDAPEPFPTLFEVNGARHAAVGATLGNSRDGEADGSPDEDSFGDDAADDDDEDGLVSQSIIAAGEPGSVTVNVQGVTETYFLNAWIDFDQNGRWSDPGEQIATDIPVTSSGNQILDFVSPLSVVSGQSVARFRLSTAAGLSFIEAAPDGEVEDHLVNVRRGDITVVEVIDNPRKPLDKRLVITGSADVDHLVLELGFAGTKNMLRLTAESGVTLNGGSVPLVFTSVTKGVSIQLLGGPDIVTVSGTKVAGPITLDGGTGDDRYIFSASKTKFAVVDAGGIDTLDFSTLSRAAKVDLAKQTGKSQSLGNGNTAKITGQIENVAGSMFNDNFKGNSGDNTFLGLGGKDKLDGREGNDILRGGEGNDTLTGGLGNDILLGDAENDTLTATAGFDILFGGFGADKLTGGKLGNSLLIGSVTAHDSDDAALLAILAEWSRQVSGASAPLEQRITRLTNGGGVNGNARLNSSTVADDALVDSLKTSVGGNWVFQFPLDKHKGLKPSDVVQT